MRFRVLAILLISTCVTAAAADNTHAADTTHPAAAPSTTVRYKEGLVHGFLQLTTLDGVAIAAGELNQVVRGDQVTSQIVFRFKDGSRQEETTVFTQRGQFRLVSYHLVQKGPSFKNPSDLSIDCATGQVTVHYTDNDGKEKDASERMKLPPDLANGLIPTLLKNLKAGTPQLEAPMVVTGPKPRLVKIVAHAEGSEPFSLVGFNREAVRYVAKVELGGVAGVVAPIVGKQPPDSQIWIVGGEAPGFLKSETPAYAEGPMWRIELVSPVWPQAPSSQAKNGDAVKH